MATQAYKIECRHVSGSSHWDQEPGEAPLPTREEAETAMRWFQANEPTDDEGAALEYRVVEDEDEANEPTDDEDTCPRCGHPADNSSGHGSCEHSCHKVQS